jgi:AraC-like DNA-binding protein
LLERILILNLDKKTEDISTLKKVPRIEILERLNLAREFMHSNIDRPISLSQIARNASLSTYHFLRLFKEVFGETPRQYLIRNRLEKARKLLVNTELSVTDISLEIGFESISHFNRLFNRRFGSSPGKFASLYRADKYANTLLLAPGGGTGHIVRGYSILRELKKIHELFVIASTPFVSILNNSSISVF